MRAHVDGGDDGAVIAAHRHRDRSETRLGLPIDQRIALFAIGNDGVQQQLGSVTVTGVSAAIHRIERRAQSSSQTTKQDAADRGAERRQAIADIEAAPKTSAPGWRAR